MAKIGILSTQSSDDKPKTKSEAREERNDRYSPPEPTPTQIAPKQLHPEYSSDRVETASILEDREQTRPPKREYDSRRSYPAREVGEYLAKTNKKRKRVFVQKTPIASRICQCWGSHKTTIKRTVSVFVFVCGCLLFGFLGDLYLRVVAYMTTGSFGYRIDRLIVEEALNLGDLFVTVAMAALVGLTVFASKKVFKNYVLDLITHQHFAIERLIKDDKSRRGGGGKTSERFASSEEGEFEEMESGSSGYHDSNEESITEEEEEGEEFVNLEEYSSERKRSYRDVGVSDKRRTKDLKVNILHGGKVYEVQ